MKRNGGSKGRRGGTPARDGRSRATRFNGVFFLSIALASATVALWYDGLHDFGEFGGAFQSVAASLIRCLLLCVAVVCLTVTLLNFSTLTGTQRILGTLPIALTGAVFVLLAVLK